MGAMDGVTVEELDAGEGMAETVYAELRERCRVLHASESKPGRLAMRAFCVCGHPSIGNGGSLCAQLRALSEGGDTAAWLTMARALDAALTTGGSHG